MALKQHRNRNPEGLAAGRASKDATTGDNACGPSFEAVARATTPQDDGGVCGCDWINGETIAMDGGHALAMGGNFYQLREWSDADWMAARDAIKAQNEKDKVARG